MGAGLCSSGGPQPLPAGWSRNVKLECEDAEVAVDTTDSVEAVPVLNPVEEPAATGAEEEATTSTKDVPPAESTDPKALYDRIGGEAAVDAAVEQFYGKLLADAALAPMFASSDMANLKDMQKKFLTYVFGGPAAYPGKMMKEAHAGKGITAAHFGAVAGHLSATLKGLGVPDAEHDEIMTIAASTQGDIVEPVEEAKTLYDRLGGEAAVDAAVEQFYGKVVADMTLLPIFASVDMASLKAMQKSFLTLAFGGPADYGGRSLSDAHAGKGITEAHFGAVAGHLSATLKGLGVPDAEHDEVMTIAASTKGDIVEAPLYARLGSEAAVDVAVEQFYGKLLADESLAPMFANSDMANLKAMQKSFLTLAFGGPAEYGGKSLKDAHAGKGITDAQFLAVAGHLSATLKGLGVPDREHDMVLTIAASTKGDIVQQAAKPKTGTPKAKATKSRTSTVAGAKAKAAPAKKAPAAAAKEEPAPAPAAAAPVEAAAAAAPEDPKEAKRRRDQEWKKMSKEVQEEKGKAIRAAAKDGPAATVEKLLKECVSTEAADHDGFTALHLAAQAGKKDICELLIKYGADPLATIKLGEYGNTPLHYAARQGHLDCVKFLVKKGKKALTVKNNNGKTPAGMAAAGACADYLEDL